MKRKLLFVMNNMGCGGAEKSLVTLLNCIDYSAYEVDLFLFEQDGIFMELIPQEVNILPAPKYWGIMNSSFKSSVRALAGLGRFDLIFCRIMQAAICRMFNSPERGEQHLWRYIKRALPALDRKYDVAFGYMEKNPVYFVVDKVNADKKAGWIHTNYSHLNINKRIENKYFSCLDHIITVSGICAETLKAMFPAQKGKVRVIENILLPELIRKMADMGVALLEEQSRKAKEIHTAREEPVQIVTVARLAYPKGIDIALEACRLLVEDGQKVVWKIVGDGPLRNQLENKIKEYHLESCFLMVGIKSNPYPYIRNADIYVQPSRYEGRSIAVDEAKVLCKPIVVTSYDTVEDQIKDRVNGIVAGASPEAICESIKLLICNKDLRDRIISNLQRENKGNESGIKNLYRLVEE